VLKAIAVMAGLLGTKPCPPPPCGRLDDAGCTAKATWVAVGRIVQVVHHVKGAPLMKDFAEIVFVPERWEKKPPAKELPQSIIFKVGWCNNMKTAPEDTSGEFRFFGDGSATMEPQYLDFRALPKAK
jgi:hypothetical protein